MKIFEIEQKEPVGILYHGTGRVFDEFQQSKARSPNDYYGGGIAYFTDDYDIALSYAKAAAKREPGGKPVIYSASITPKNHFDIDKIYPGEFVRKIIPKGRTEDFARVAGLLPYGTNKYKIISALEKGDLKLSGDQIWRAISFNNTKSKRARNFLIKLGFDALRYTGGLNMGGKEHNVWLPYDEKEIKILDRQIT